NDCHVIVQERDKEENPKIVQICLWIIDSGYSKHMTGNHALLTNFVEKFLGMVRFGNNDRAEVYYECMEPFKSLKCLWVRSKSIAAIWLEKVVTPLIVPAIKGFVATSAVLKPKHLKVDKHGMSEPMSYYLID
nr:integrase, catalytic region, zinc finger, CCHC-type, peptidase aspartic, catalytic [Tanacetum cinerariifolium]